MMYQASEKRYEEMRYHRAGDSGLLLPEVSLGLWHNFGDTGVYDNMKGFVLRHLTRGSHILTWQITTGRHRAVRRRISEEC